MDELNRHLSFMVLMASETLCTTAIIPNITPTKIPVTYEVQHNCRIVRAHMPLSILEK